MSQPERARPRLQANLVLCLAGEQIGTFNDMLDLYQRRIIQLGMSPSMMFYNSELQHHQKLAAISHVLRHHLGPADSLLDIGCGYGELVKYLPDLPYVGIEPEEAMATEALRRYPRREFLCQQAAMVRRRADWSVLAGVVNSAPDPGQLLIDSWRLCRRALIADVIREGTLPKTFADLNRFRLADVFDFCRWLGARRVEIAASTRHWSLVIAWK